jgi:hypothetical protein
MIPYRPEDLTPKQRQELEGTLVAGLWLCAAGQVALTLIGLWLVDQAFFGGQLLPAALDFCASVAKLFVRL